MRGLMFCFLAFALLSCHSANPDLLHEKLVDECGVVPLAPACANDDDNEDRDEATRRAIDRFAATIDNQSDEQCLLAIDCSEQNIIDQVGACHEITLPQSNPFYNIALDDDDCLLLCLDDLDTCGEVDDCGADVVDRCIDGFYDCLRECPTSPSLL